MKKGQFPVNRLGKIPITKIKDPRYQKKPYQLLVRVQGKRSRTYYSSYDAAEKAWKKHNRIELRYGNTALEYDRKAHIEYSQAKEIVGADTSLVDVAKLWKKHYAQLQSAPTATKASALFLEQKLKLGRSKRHHDDLKSRLQSFVTSFAQKKVNTITGNQILEWLLSLDNEPRTIHNYSTTLSNFFNWCKRRKWIAQTPMEDINEDDLPTIPKKPKGVLSLTQTAAMFEWIEANRPHYAAWFALQAFAGVRRSEVDRFCWEWVDYQYKRIVLPGWIFHLDFAPKQGTKTQDDGVLQNLPDNIWAWLAKYGSASGKIRKPANNAMLRMRKAFATFHKNRINPWPNNALRHTFCTMHISLYESAEKTALLLRHQNTRQLYQNYLAKIVPTAEAKEYFNIRPQ